MKEIVNRWACGAGAIGRLRCFVRFAVGGGLIAAALGPAFGVPVPALIGAISPDPELFTGSALGLALAPALILGVRHAPQQVARRGRRGADGFAIVFVKLDDLKQINDTQGHFAADRVLVRLANAVSVNCRSIDSSARIGDDEFCVIMPGADAEMAWHVAERIARTLGVESPA